MTDEQQRIALAKAGIVTPLIDPRQLAYEASRRAWQAAHPLREAGPPKPE